MDMKQQLDQLKAEKAEIRRRREELALKEELVDSRGRPRTTMPAPNGVGALGAP